jgi:hypothetical protein
MAAPVEGVLAGSRPVTPSGLNVNAHLLLRPAAIKATLPHCPIAPFPNGPIVQFSQNGAVSQVPNQPPCNPSSVHSHNAGRPQLRM